MNIHSEATLYRENNIVASIYRYQKVIDAYTTHQLALPYGAEGDFQGQEIGVIGGHTYAVLFDGVSLPVQPQEISVESVTLNAGIIAALNAVSPHLRLANSRANQKFKQGKAATPEQITNKTAIGAVLELWAATQNDQNLMTSFEDLALIEYATEFSGDFNNDFSEEFH